MTMPLAETLARARQGENEAFALIYDNFSRTIHSYVYRLLGNRALADEVTQETFLRAWQRLAQLRDDDRLESWLYTIASRLCTDLHRRKASYLLPLHPEHEEIADPQSNVDLALAEHELVEHVLAQLDSKYAVPLVLRHVEGFSCAEIAEMLSISVENVWQRLSRGREMFASAYARSDKGRTT